MAKHRFLICLILISLFTTLTSIGCAQESSAKTKKAVMIIAHQGFQDKELMIPKKVLESNGVEVKIASSDLSPAKGVLGGEIVPDMLLGDIDVKNFDAVIFVGGPGANQYWDDPLAHKIAQDAAASGRVVGAICIAPVTLANAGILNGKRATVWPSEGGKLKNSGADYIASPVEVDGKIITASGPKAAEEFGEALAQALVE